MLKRTANDLKDLVKSVRDRSFQYSSRDSMKRNWSDYDRAQVNEIADVLESMRDMVNMASSRIKEKRGVREGLRYPAAT